MRPLPLIGLLIALAGCAAVAPQGDGAYRTMKYDEGDRPAILFVGAPPAGLLPEQVIGDEHHPPPGDGHS